MGVDGLHGLVKEIGAQRSALDLKGQTLGVDGYGWLHKAAYACAAALVAGVPTTRLVESIDRRVRLYESCGVKLYFVFDGAPLAAKDRVNAKREASRQAAARTGSGSAKAALDITPDHAAQVIAYLTARGIRYVVAPYEADAQLVYLEQTGHIDAILSEDGDLLVFGAQRLLTKADPSGSCIEIAAAKFAQSQLAPMAAPGERDWTRLLRAFAILRGCDYAAGVSGVGPKKALQLVRRYGSVEACVNGLGRLQPLPAGILDEAKTAELAFSYQRVWDPEERSMTTLNEPGEDTVLADQAVGAPLEPELASRIARGIICPLTHRTLIVPPVVASWVRTLRPYSTANAKTDTRATRRIASFATPMAKQTTFTTSPFFARSTASTPTSRTPSAAATPTRSSRVLPLTPLSISANREDTIADSPSSRASSTILAGKENTSSVLVGQTLPHNPNLTPAPTRKRGLTGFGLEQPTIKRRSQTSLTEFNFDQFKYAPSR